MFEEEQQIIGALLSTGHAELACEEIIKFLKKDSGNINRNLFALHQLSFISGNYNLPLIGNTFKNKAILKSEKIISALKKIDLEELEIQLLCTEASVEDAIHKNKIRSGENYIESIKQHLQKTITNYWKALKINTDQNERYNQVNNIANSLAFAGRFVEALDMLKSNYQTDASRFQSFASWSITAEKLKHFAILPDSISYNCVVAENYLKAINADSDPYRKEELSQDLNRLREILFQNGVDLSEDLLTKNHLEEYKEFDGFSEYRKFVLNEHLSLNEHALHCFCKNSEKDNLNIGFGTGSYHVLNNNNFIKIERSLSRIKSEYSFARLLYYKYLKFKDDNDLNYSKYYIDSDIDDLKSLGNVECESFELEHLRTAYRISYSILDKIARILLLLYNIDAENKHYYFENVFNLFPQLKEKKNQHLYALYSMTLDLSREKTDFKGALKIFKDIRNKFEHDILVITPNSTNLEYGEINVNEFASYLKELLKITRASIFSVVFLIRTETIIEMNDYP